MLQPKPSLLDPCILVSLEIFLHRMFAYDLTIGVSIKEFNLTAVGYFVFHSGQSRGVFFRYTEALVQRFSLGRRNLLVSDLLPNDG